MGRDRSATRLPSLGARDEKAAAIVIDEGGLACHAAIVSRELGVPCIVGTKIATQVFKDGDLVVVDANVGLVRKLSGQTTKAKQSLKNQSR